MQESYKNFFNKNFAKDRDTLIEQSKNYFTQKYLHEIFKKIITVCEKYMSYTCTVGLGNY